LSGTELKIGGSRRDIHAWLQAENVQRSNAFLIHDPCGCLHRRYKNVLRRYGYEVNVFNPAGCGGCGGSVRYNPFSYVKGDGGVTELAAAVMRGTKGSGDFDDYGFLSAETLLLTALIGFVYENAPSFEWNFSTVLEMLNNMEYPEDWDDDYKTAVDFMFEAWEKREPFNMTVQRYNHFKATPYKKDGRLYQSCAGRLAPLVTKQAVDFMSKDELRLDDLSYMKIAVFVKTGQNCLPLDFLTPLMYAQFFKLAYEQINP
jgi:type IV secretion system protein VirD4